MKSNSHNLNKERPDLFFCNVKCLTCLFEIKMNCIKDKFTNNLQDKRSHEFLCNKKLLMNI